MLCVYNSYIIFIYIYISYLIAFLGVHGGPLDFGVRHLGRLLEDSRRLLHPLKGREKKRRWGRKRKFAKNKVGPLL